MRRAWTTHTVPFVREVTSAKPTIRVNNFSLRVNCFGIVTGALKLELISRPCLAEITSGPYRPTHASTRASKPKKLVTLQIIWRRSLHAGTALLVAKARYVRK